MTGTAAIPAAGGFPPGRYGRRRAPRRGPRWARAAVLGCLVAAVLAAATFAGLELAQRYAPGRDYDPRVERFYDLTDRQVVVEFTVPVPPGRTAVCAVRARDAGGGEVGREEVRVTPEPGQRLARVVHRLATTARPVTAEVQRCWPAPAGPG